ncbi:hypothetical protein AB3N44_22065 [Enterobacter chuandaensis]|uniref:hypothetical protein n=1 Tax=Enterobacter chuandaensis TaxID=2497875 RepID=UPI003877CCBF
MSNIDKRAESVSRIIADLKLKHGSGDTYAPIMRWDELLALLDELEAAEKRIAELEALARGVKQYSEFQICHYGATEDYAKGYIDCQNNYNKVLFAEAGKGE